MKKFLVVACSLALALSVIELEPSAKVSDRLDRCPNWQGQGSHWEGESTAAPGGDQRLSFGRNISACRLA